MNKAIFLDRDGTINKNKEGYIHKLTDLKLIFGVIEGLKIMKKEGYKLIIITNQSGIGRGYYTEQDYFCFREELHKILAKKDILIDAEYFCPHHKEAKNKYGMDCNCRKPKIGMLEQAAREFDLSLKDCWMIGDNISDIQAGKNANCKTIHVLTGECNYINYADFTAKNLIEAANYIVANQNT